MESLGMHPNTCQTFQFRCTGLQQKVCKGSSTHTHRLRFILYNTLSFGVVHPPWGYFRDAWRAYIAKGRAFLPIRCQTIASHGYNNDITRQLHSCGDRHRGCVSNFISYYANYLHCEQMAVMSLMESGQW